MHLHTDSIEYNHTKNTKNKKITRNRRNKGNTWWLKSVLLVCIATAGLYTAPKVVVGIACLFAKGKTKKDNKDQ